MIMVSSVWSDSLYEKEPFVGLESVLTASGK